MDAIQAIALQRSELDVVQAAVDVSREATGCNVTFAALPEGDRIRIALANGVQDPRFTEIRMSRGMGLGGSVWADERAAFVEDYAHDPRMPAHLVEIVSGGEGLRGVVCVPILWRGRFEGLLYAARHGIGSVGDRATDGLLDVARHAALGIESARERRRELELQRLRDRERTATQLHDSVAQMLFGIGVAARQSLRAGDPAALETAMQEIETTAADARRELRATLERLAEADEALGFEARLEGELRLFARRTGCSARLARSGTPQSLPDTVEDLLVDTAVEGLRNAVKHTGATFCLVYLDHEPARVKLAVQSEVAGDRVTPPSRRSGTGCGLQLLTARARRLGGTLALHPGEQDACVLRLEVPVRQGLPTV